MLKRRSSEETLRAAALACWENAGSLSAEAKLLADHGYGARAVALAVLALEEFAKAIGYALAGRKSAEGLWSGYLEFKAAVERATPPLCRSGRRTAFFGLAHGTTISFLASGDASASRSRHEAVQFTFDSADAGATMTGPVALEWQRFTKLTDARSSPGGDRARHGRRVRRARHPRDHHAQPRKRETLHHPA
jgi:hypothetical protein